MNKKRQYQILLLVLMTIVIFNLAIIFTTLTDTPDNIYNVTTIGKNANGTVYNDPAFTSILAAKICLEGFFLSDDALYFLAPKYASSSWISKNKNYEFTIENHEFYS